MLNFIELDFVRYNGGVQVPEASATPQAKQRDANLKGKHQTRWLWVACNAGLAPAPGSASTDQACVLRDRAATRHNRRGFSWIRHDVST